MYRSPSPNTDKIPFICFWFTSREIHSIEYETKLSPCTSSCWLFVARILFTSFNDDNNMPLSLTSMPLNVSGKTVTIDHLTSLLCTSSKPSIFHANLLLGCYFSTFLFNPHNSIDSPMNAFCANSRLPLK